MKKDILHLIKNSGASRKFKKRKIPTKLIRKVVEAGRWGLSVLGIQPWKIVCITRKAIIEKIANMVDIKSREIDKYLLFQTSWPHRFLLA